MKARLRFPLVLATAGLTFIACSDDPVGLEDDHAEPEGVELVAGGTVLASYDGGWTGVIELDAGAESAVIELRFLDHDGEPIVLDEDYYLTVDVAEESVAVFEQTEAGAFEGRVRAIAIGQTDMTFHLMHGALGAGHPEFVAPGLQVHVN